MWGNNLEDNVTMRRDIWKTKPLMISTEESGRRYGISPVGEPTAGKTRVLEMVSQRQPNLYVGELGCQDMEKSKRFDPIEHCSNQVMCNYETSQRTIHRQM